MEELSGDELEEMVEERYKPGSSFVTYAEAEYDPRKLIVGDVVVPSSEDPTIWKVKCTVGHERYSAFCLMQKYVDLQSLGTKLSVVSAFVIEHVKGFIYIEAERQLDVIEACKGLYCIYTSQIAPVPKKEISRLLSLQSKCNEVAVGTWVHVKNGIYKGDLAEVIAVNEARKRATVKLIPRVDLQAIAAKFGGGISSKKAATPAPRLISSTELQEFGPLIQYRRDHDTGQTFAVLDGLMLKDGYLYKKVSISSLSFYCLVPSEEELLVFEPFKRDDSDCQEWLTQLYGEQEGKRKVKSDRGGWEGEGSPSASMACSLKVHDLVLFNQKDFGVIVGTGKDDSFKVLKEGSEGPVAVTVELHQLKNLSFPKKLTALDHCLKTISIDDTVRVLDGPLQGRQGIVKQIFRGTIFLYDENEQENNGYFCCKSQICEKIESCDDAFNGKGGESSSTGIDDFLLSPKSPVSTKKPMQTRENSNSFNRENKDGNITIGQSLRIRVGPMKGYLCCVLAVYHSAITVKLDSHHKILTVKREHLSQVHGKSSAVSLCEDAESVKPFGLLGTQDCSGDRMAGVRTSSEGERCGAGALSTVRNSWPAFQHTGLSLEPESNFANPRNSVKNNTNKAVGIWESKAPPSRNSSWHIVVAEEKAVGNRSSRDGFSGSKAAWNGPLAQPKNQTLMKKELEYIERTGKFYCNGMPSSGNQGFGGWNKHGIGNNDNACHQGSWDETRTFDGGCGSSGRRGRGGSSRGGRSQFGSVRTFGRGHGASAGTSSPNLSNWSGGRAGCQGSGKESDGGGDDRFGKGVYGGRGGSDRGGFGGRGQSNLRGCGGGGGGGSDSGGFQGRGTSERGGFRGRGRGNGGSNQGNLRGCGGGGGGGGSDRGSFQRRGTSERGGFRGRGRGNGGSNQGTGFAKDAGVSDVAPSGWTSQASVFDGGESKRSDRGGYGGRGGSGRGGFGGRGRSNGGGGCRGGARFDTGDFRGRGRLERGGLGGRGHGRRDQNSEWSSIMASSWNKGPTSGEWWKNVDSGGSALNAVDGGRSSGWNQAKDAKGGPDDEWSKAVAASCFLGKGSGGGGKGIW